MSYNNQLSELEVNRQNDLSQLDQQYQNAITETEQAYKQAADQYTIDANDGRTTAVEQLMETQTALTEQAVKEIEQQREQSEKDYIKEQAGAYADWQKQSDAYGVNAEKMAANGLTRSGYSESSQVQMYSDYQSRVIAARDAQKRAQLNFTNAIANARAQNNAALAQIALDAFQKQSEIALSGLTAKNGLLSEWTSQKLAVNTRYDNKYQTILDQIYREEQMQLQREQMAQDQARWQAQMAQDQAQFEAGLAADKEKLAWQETQAQLEREWEAQQDQISRDWQAEQDQIDRDWRAQQSQLDRDKYTGNGGDAKLTGDATLTGDTGDEPKLTLTNPFPGVFDTYNSMKPNSTVPTTAAGTPLVTRQNTVDYLTQRGVPNPASQIMTKSEWIGRKNASNTKDTWVTTYDTYEEYLINKRDSLLFAQGQWNAATSGKTNYSW